MVFYHFRGKETSLFYLGNMLEFHHIMDKQPEKNTPILQVDRPMRFENFYRKTTYQHCFMGMRIWTMDIPFSEYIETAKRDDWPLPDFFWCYVDDFHNEFPNIGALK